MTKDISAGIVGPPAATTTVFHQQGALNALFYAETFVGNAAVTILIIWKIFRTTRRLRTSALFADSQSYTRIIATLVEASLGHSCCLLFAALFTIHVTAIEASRYVIVMAAAGISAGAGPTMIIFMLAVGKTIEHRSSRTGDNPARPTAVVNLPSRSDGSATLKDSGEIHEL